MSHKVVSDVLKLPIPKATQPSMKQRRKVGVLFRDLNRNCKIVNMKLMSTIARNAAKSRFSSFANINSVGKLARC